MYANKSREIANTSTSPVSRVLGDGERPGRRYMFSAFMDVDSVRKIIKLNSLSMANGREPYTMVFESRERRLAFKEAFSEVLKSSPEWSGQSAAKVEKAIFPYVTDRLDRMSAQDVLYIQGHGLPGGRGVSSKKGEFRGMGVIADALIKMMLPGNVKVKLISCWSGAEAEIVIPAASAKKYHDAFNYIEANQGRFSHTSAGMLDAALRQRQVDRSRGSVFGYLGQITSFPQEQEVVERTSEGKFRRSSGHAVAAFPIEGSVGQGDLFMDFRRSLFRRSNPCPGV